MPAEGHLQFRPETPAVDYRAVGWAGGAALLLLFGTIGAFYAIYDRAVPVKTIPQPETFPQPRVVTSAVEIAARRQLSETQIDRLSTWQWADPQHTLVQIPIDRAMQMLVAKGAKAYDPLLPPQPTLSSPAAAAQNATTPNPSEKQRQ
jgi:hypothetical protein